ncbi:unnamed protein product [Trichogramma brassicae]|uniref:Uncharacterized protein n=1 Tax=Trichogramma brassicae TaxID=86971 RepID=A0A6H5I788_9HYME|nr:unnamed protein product [Trichogramma brassicae]
MRVTMCIAVHLRIASQRNGEGNFSKELQQSRVIWLIIRVVRSLTIEEAKFLHAYCHTRVREQERKEIRASSLGQRGSSRKQFYVAGSWRGSQSQRAAQTDAVHALILPKSRSLGRTLAPPAQPNLQSCKKRIAKASPKANHKGQVSRMCYTATAAD